MGKKSKRQDVVVENGVMPLVEFKYADPLFHLVAHPEQAMIVSGLATGHILCHRYDPAVLQESLDKKRSVESAKKKESGEDTKAKRFWTVVRVDTKDSEPSADGVELVWKTKRHKGSVRAVCTDATGEYLYSIGTDNVLKKAEFQTGKVVKKKSIEGGSKVTKLVKSLTHDFLVMGDEDGTITVLDSNDLSTKNVLEKIHGGDAINDIFQFCKRSVYKYISLGQTTLAYWDTREPKEKEPPKKKKNIGEEDTDLSNILMSDDQEDEIICGAFVDPEEGDVLACGMGEGILTIWKPKKNDLEDQLSRVKVAKGESIDSIIPTLQDDNCVWCGCSNGLIYKVDCKRGKVLEARKHSSLDEVNFLDLDFEFRVISGGMDKVKIWELPKTEEHELSSDNSNNEVSSDDESLDEAESGSESDSDMDSDSDSDMDSESDPENNSDLDSEQEQQEDGKDDREALWKELDLPTDESEPEEEKKKRPAPKQQKKKNLKKQKTNNPSHGITKFEGL